MTEECTTPAASAAERVGPRLKELCGKQRITVYRLSQMTGITQTVLGKIIKGKSVPTIQTLDRICEALGISLAQFFAEDELPGLSEDQQEFVETWNGLNAADRDRLMQIVRTFQ